MNDLTRSLWQNPLVRCMAVCTAFSTPIPKKPRKSVSILYKCVLGPPPHKKIVHAVEFLCYDDGCHLRKFTNNPVRSTLTDTTKRIAAMEIVIDKMYFMGRIDLWCRRYCNPKDFDELKKYTYTCKLIHITIQCALFIHKLTPKSVSKCFPGCRGINE